MTKLFTPPSTSGTLIADPAKINQSAAHRLWYHYGAWAEGQTVWKDSGGTWHTQLSPYQGGSTDRVFYDGVLTSEEGPDEGLATAEQVYLGGHVYEVSDSVATELTSAGFGSYLNTEPVTLHWTQDEADLLSKVTISVDSPNVSASPVVEQTQGVFRLASGDDVAQSGLREFWTHPHTDGWTDTTATFTVDPPNFGTFGVGNVLPQAGVALRLNDDGATMRAVTINNNIIFGVSVLNIGVWAANLDGTGFVNRQHSFDFPDQFVPFPFTVEAVLVDNLVTISIYPAGGSIIEGPSHVETLDLDTDCGDAGTIPTPTGTGINGVLCAHIGTSSLSACRFGRVDFVRTS